MSGSRRLAQSVHLRSRRSEAANRPEGRTLPDEWRVGITYAVALQRARDSARQLRQRGERPTRLTVRDRHAEIATLSLEDA